MGEVLTRTLKHYRQNVRLYISCLNTGECSPRAAPLNGETGFIIRSGNETLAAICIQLRNGKLARV